jgi:hypothetical protein
MSRIQSIKNLNNDYNQIPSLNPKVEPGFTSPPFQFIIEYNDQ